jgi:hypothetical protein
MRRGTRDFLTSVLVGASLLFMVGPIAAAGFGWLDGRDFLVQIAAIPGCFIIGGIVYLTNGCVEYYADVLPRKYRQRPSQEAHWRETLSDDDIRVAGVALEAFAVSNGFRREDAFQFHPDDRLWQLLGDFYPGRKYPECLDATCQATDSDGPASATAVVLLRSNASMAEYVRAGLEGIKSLQRGGQLGIGRS